MNSTSAILNLLKQVTNHPTCFSMFPVTARNSFAGTAQAGFKSANTRSRFFPSLQPLASFPYHSGRGAEVRASK